MSYKISFAFTAITTRQRLGESHIDTSQKYISDNNLDEISYLGDFNYVISNFDTNAKPRFPTIAKKWLAFESSNSIFDTFRFKCPKRRLYSSTHTGTSKTRIDRIYVPSTLINQIKTTLFHKPGVRDGHRIVEATSAPHSRTPRNFVKYTNSQTD